jgi:DNA-binding transcriptional MerR regulator
MDKAPDAYRTISEVADDLDLPQHVLRFWETRFNQIKPLKRGGGRRYYRPDDVELLKGIRHLLYKEGYTIKGVQRILKEQGPRAVQAFVRERMLPESAAPAEPAARAAMPEFAPPLAPVPTSAAPLVPLPAPEPVYEDEVDAAVDEQPEDFPAAISAPAPQEPAAPPAVAPLPPAEAAASRSEMLPLQPDVSPRPVSKGQVSMFRGGLQRGDGPMPATSLPEFTGHARTSETQSRVEDPMPRLPDPVDIGHRETLRLALDELTACRARIDQILARREG